MDKKKKKLPVHHQSPNLSKAKNCKVLSGFAEDIINI